MDTSDLSLYVIFMLVSSIYILSDKHLNISFRYFLYLKLREQLILFIKERI